MSGYLRGFGGYYGEDMCSFCWSSTMSKLSPESEPGIFGRFLSKDYSTLYRSYDGKSQNFSVRCLKD